MTKSLSIKKAQVFVPSVEANEAQVSVKFVVDEVTDFSLRIYPTA